MNIRRTLVVLAALMLLPSIALAKLPIKIKLPPVTPAPGTAVIAVQKFFDDGNNETSIELTLKCTAGDYNGNPVDVDAPFDELDYEHVFVVDNIPLGPDNVCTVTETPIDGYQTKAQCQNGFGNSEPDSDCGFEVNNKKRLSYCQFNNLSTGDAAICILENQVLPVDVEVTKTWDITGTGGDNYDRYAEITIGCDAEIEDGYKQGNKWYINKYLYEFSYLDEDDMDTGMATVTAMVYPEWYKTANDPDNQKSTECWAVESDTDSAVEVESDCGDKSAPGMSVSAGNGDSCDITNTLFFEGIPTLNQYGMAIMALLMLGMGFVGFRRFV